MRCPASIHIDADKCRDYHCLGDVRHDGRYYVYTDNQGTILWDTTEDQNPTDTSDGEATVAPSSALLLVWTARGVTYEEVTNIYSYALEIVRSKLATLSDQTNVSIFSQIFPQTDSMSATISITTSP